VIVVDVAIVDAQGELCPRTTNLVEFSVAGAVELLGVGNGNPVSHEADKAAKRTAFHGRCQVILQAERPDVTATLTARSVELQSATLTLDAVCGVAE
jgi:beta-galactosidase